MAAKKKAAAKKAPKKNPKEYTKAGNKRVKGAGKVTYREGGKTTTNADYDDASSDS
jgi:hypothetical protein